MNRFHFPLFLFQALLYQIFNRLHIQKAFWEHDHIYRRWKVLTAIREHFIVYLNIIFNILLITLQLYFNLSSLWGLSLLSRIYTEHGAFSCALTDSYFYFLVLSPPLCVFIPFVSTCFLFSSIITLSIYTLVWSFVPVNVCYWAFCSLQVNVLSITYGQKLCVVTKRIRWYRWGNLGSSAGLLDLLSMIRWRCWQENLRLELLLLRIKQG